MRARLAWLVYVLVLGTALGIGTAVATIWRLGEAGTVHVGPWQTPLDAGGPDRTANLRATAALRATLALSRAEAIYFAATTDGAGDRLRGDCRYRLHFASLPARWWSITLYGADLYLIPNPQNRYAYASVSAAPDKDGSFTVTVAPTPQPGNWLNGAARAHLVLLTRLYEPSAAASANPAHIALPTIDRLGCP